MELDTSKLPKHVAIIMDGNGRWAKRQGLPRIYGHQKGVEVAKRIITKTWELGIPVLTLFAFSKENWERPKEEVTALFELLKNYLDSELENLKEKEICFRVIGDKEDFPAELQEKLNFVERITEKYNKLILCMALSYGGRTEILKATRKIAEKVKKNEIEISEITEEVFRKFLYTKELPDPDLLIRTSGEMRISNFLIFQSAYTEFYFTEVCWPEFTEEEYLKALISYQQRIRKFGRVYEF